MKREVAVVLVSRDRYGVRFRQRRWYGWSGWGEVQLCSENSWTKEQAGLIAAMVLKNGVVFGVYDRVYPIVDRESE